MAVVAALRAQQPISYTDGETKSTAYSTTAPYDPTTLTIASGTATQSGAFSGSGSLIKAGAGTLTLTNANSGFTGTTTVSAGTLSFNNSGGLPNSAVTVDSGATVFAGNFSSYNIGSISGAGAVSFSYGTLYAGGNSASTTFSGSLSGSGTLVKTGTGTLTFTGTSSGGQLAVSGGTLAFSPSSASNYNGPVGVQSGGYAIIAPTDPSKFVSNLNVQSGGSATIALPNSTPLGTTDVSVNSGGSLTMDSTYMTTALSNTKLVVTGGASLTLPGEGVVLGGLQNFSGGTITIAPTGFWVVPNLTVGANNISSSFGGTLTFTGSSYSPNIMKIGTGTWTLVGATNFAPVVKAGYVALESAAAGTGIQLQGGGLRYNTSMTHTGGIVGQTGGGTIDTGSNNVTLSGTLAGGSTSEADTLNKIGAGTLTLTGSSTSFTGKLAINAGTVSVSSSANLGVTSGAFASRVAFGGGTLRTTASFTSEHPIVLSTAGGTIDANGNTTLTWNGAITSAPGNTTSSTVLTKTGGGTLSLGGTNTYTGATLISSGTLIGNTASLPGPITATANTTLTFSQSTNGTFSNQISGGGAVIKTGAGALTLLGNQTFTGGLTINDGTVIGNTTSLTGAIAVTANGTLTFDQASNGTFGNIISGSGAFTKIGAGALTVTANQTFTGSTSINAGTFIVGNSGSLGNTTVSVADGATLAGTGTIGGPTTFASGSHLAPGNSPGTLTFTNGLTLTQGAILDFQLGTNSDLIRVTNGTLTGPGVLGGVVINLSDAGGFNTLDEGTLYTVINFSGASTASFLTSYFTIGTVIPGTSAANYTFGLTGSELTLTYSASASAIPEPSTYAAIFGACALGLAALVRRSATREGGWRRRRQS